MSEDKTELVYNDQNENSNTTVEKKALDRMVAEGYRYQVLNNKEGSSLLDPIEDEEQRIQKRRWLRVKILMLFGVILITCLAVVIIFQHFKYESENHECTSERCVKDAAYILNKMDVTVNPCEDFYQFSCGRWQKTTVIPPSKSKYGSFTQISDEIDSIMKEILESKEKPYKGKQSSAIHKAKMYYQMCMNEAKIQATGTEPVLKLIKDLGSWDFTSDPTSGTLDVDTWTLAKAVLQADLIGFSPFFTMSLSADEKNSSQYRIKFEQSGLTLDDSQEYFPNHTNYDQFAAAYKTYLKDFVTLLGATADIDQKVTDLFDFEQQLALINVPREELIDPASYYHSMSVQEFQDKYLGNWLNMESFMRDYFGDIAKVPMDTQIVVFTPDYFIKLQPLIEKTSKRTLANYVVWMCIQNMGGYLPSAFSEASLKLEKVESGVTEFPPRWKRCLSKTNAAFGFATGALYVQDYFQEESKKDVEALFEDIRRAFIANLDNVEWMDDKTRSYAAEKARAVNKMLGYPDYILDPDKLDDHFKNLTLEDGKFFESRLAILIFYNKKNMLHFRTTPDRTEWDMIPTEVNGYYSPDFNHIAFPAGILRPPLYNPTAPKSFNFGSFGMICGHELTHGFDNRGRKFDKDGNMRDWWTKSSTENFERKSQCYVDFYSNYTVNGTHLNGETTLSENIADNGGMKTAYLAYQSWKRQSGGTETFVLPGLKYTSDQLFFLGMAQIWCSHYTPEYLQQSILTDVHSISKYRVLGSMANSKEFAEAYKCPKNSGMNPEHKCAVW